MAPGCPIEPWAREPPPVAVPAPAFALVGDAKSQSRFGEPPACRGATRREPVNPERARFEHVCSSQDLGPLLSVAGGGLCEREHQGRARLPAAPVVSPALVERSPARHWGERLTRMLASAGRGVLGPPPGEGWPPSDPSLCTVCFGNVPRLQESYKNSSRSSSPPCVAFVIVRSAQASLAAPVGLAPDQGPSFGRSALPVWASAPRLSDASRVSQGPLVSSLGPRPSVPTGSRLPEPQSCVPVT